MNRVYNIPGQAPTRQGVSDFPTGAPKSDPLRPICRTRLKYELKLGLGKVRTLTGKYELSSMDLSSDLAKYYFGKRAMSVLKRFQEVLNQVVLKGTKVRT